jgi:hypothetical protein
MLYDRGGGGFRPYGLVARGMTSGDGSSPTEGMGRSRTIGSYPPPSRVVTWTHLGFVPLGPPLPRHQLPVPGSGIRRVTRLSLGSQLVTVSSPLALLPLKVIVDGAEEEVVHRPDDEARDDDEPEERQEALWRHQPLQLPLLPLLDVDADIFELDGGRLGAKARTKRASFGEMMRLSVEKKSHGLDFHRQDDRGVTPTAGGRGSC